MDNGARATSGLQWTTTGLAAATLYVCWPLWPALVLAAWTAALARPLLPRVERGFKGRRRAAGSLLLLIFLLVLLPLVLVVLGVISGAQELAGALAQSPSARSALEAIASGPDAAAAPHLPRNLPDVIALLQRYGAQGLGVLSRVAGAATTGLVGIFIYFAAAFTFLVDGPQAWEWLRQRSPMRPGQLDRLAAAFQETGRGLLVGIGLTAVAQGVVATLAYAALGVPRWWVLGPITGLGAIIPVAGSALVWGPISVGFFLTGHTVKAVVLAVIGVAVISSADNVLRPVFARMGSLRMSMFVLLVSLFGGVAAFGPWGAILGPLIVRLCIEALDMHREAVDGPDTTPAR